jgi:hypothetical protein
VPVTAVAVVTAAATIATARLIAIVSFFVAVTKAFHCH